ncbi:hypothetical protein LWC34_24670 [Kibdelosporangium philippinense]|uniref:Secreted protein n=1 Tax=Kibdelosporangium philippinense TaxID=211113 RepID=A0ABS8ZDT4_9PSEU|nr:hypothetical protein [Kibdelosporangium philippinense]MCE7006001.1 hypothetical protein [Kibdelosporangium philippinense]
MGYGRSVTVTALLSLLVAAGAVGTAAYLRSKNDEAAASPTLQPQASSGICRHEPCEVVATAMMGNTRIELIRDAGGQGARLKVGDDRVIESRLPGRGATLGPDSLDCVAGTLSACLVKGKLDTGTVGEVVVGRSGKWNVTTPTYLSTANYLKLTNVLGDGAPEVVTVQRGFFAQVFTLEGADLGCTAVMRQDRLPGKPTEVKPTEAQLQRPCPN